MSLNAESICQEECVLDEQTGETRIVDTNYNLGDIRICNVLSGRDVERAAFAENFDAIIKTESNLISEVCNSGINVLANTFIQQNSSSNMSDCVSVSDLISGRCQNAESEAKDVGRPDMVLVNMAPEREIKEEMDISEEVLQNDSSDFLCETKDSSNIIISSSDNGEMTDFESVSENLYKASSEVDNILETVNNDDNVENCAPVLNPEPCNKTNEVEEVIFKCGFCSWGDKNIQRLSSHIKSCNLKRKLLPRAPVISRKKRPDLLTVAPRPSIVMDTSARIPFTTNAQYFITPQDKLNLIPKISTNSSSSLQSQVPVLPSAQLALTPQGQLIARPGTQLLFSTKPSQPVSGTARQPTLLGVGIGTNPTNAAKNIVLLPNFILSSAAAAAVKHSAAKSSVCLQSPLVLQNPAPNISTEPVQRNVFFTHTEQPQVLLSPIYLSSNSVSNTDKSTIASSEQQPNISNSSCSFSPVNISSSNKQELSEKLKDVSGPTNQAAFICEICDDHAQDLVKLREHMKCIHEISIHSKAVPCFHCQKCQYSFFTGQGLERHLVGSHGLVTVGMQDAADKGTDGGRCPICGWGYQSRLLDHISSDHKVTLKPAGLSYKCTLCTASFVSYKQFEKHVYSKHRSNLTKSKLRQKFRNSSAAV